MEFLCGIFSCIRSIIHGLLSDRPQYNSCNYEDRKRLSSAEFRFAGWNPETIEAYRYNISRFSNSAANNPYSYGDHSSQSKKPAFVDGGLSSSSSSKPSRYSSSKQHKSSSSTLPRPCSRPPVSSKDIASSPQTVSAAVEKETLPQTISDCSSDKLKPSYQSTRKEATFPSEKASFPMSIHEKSVASPPISLPEKYAASPPTVAKKTPSPLKSATPSPLKTPPIRTMKSDFISPIKEESTDRNLFKKGEFAFATNGAPSSPLEPPPPPRKTATNDAPSFFPTQKGKSGYAWKPKGGSPGSGPDYDPTQPLHSTLKKEKLYTLSSDLPTENSKTRYVSVMKEASSIFEVPEYLKDLFEREILPTVLKRLTPEAYRKYFTTLLHAEDFYAEKWSKFILKGVSLELQNASIYRRHAKNKKKGINIRYEEDDDEDDTVFVKFEVDSIPKKRPYLLSRDFVFLKPVPYSQAEPFQGVIYRVVKSTTVLAEFGGDFLAGHESDPIYDVTFSFNRVCLKRCHLALRAISSEFSRRFLFPEGTRPADVPRPGPPMADALSRIRGLKSGHPPHLIVGCDLSVDRQNNLTRTGELVRAAVLMIRGTHEESRVLIVSYCNKNCDTLMGSLKPAVPESEMFRANAAFRKYNTVPGDILSMSEYEGECFTCPPLTELKTFRVVSSTPISSSRLHSVGIGPGHFTHIFLLDASSMIEPEAILPLVNLAGETTAVIVAGSLSDRPAWVRSDVGRHNGLTVSYFERLLGMDLYASMSSSYVSCV